MIGAERWLGAWHWRHSRQFIPSLDSAERGAGKHDGAAPAWNGRRPIPVRPRAGGHPGQTCWPHERAGSPPARGRTECLTLGVRLALRIDDLLELAEHVHAGQQLLQARVRLALLLDGGDELAVLELDAVH